MNDIIRYSLVLCLATTINLAFGQLPATDIFLVNYSNVDTLFNIKKVSYLTGFNPNGYNNQPYFFGTDDLYISSDYYSLEKPEIIKLDLYSLKLERMTMSPESDFSPSPLPYDDGFSTVRIELDGETQSLWAYDYESFDDGHRLMEDISTIGYYKWLSESDIAMFLLPSPFTLHMADISDGSSKLVLDNIGRCFKQDENGHLLFTHLVNDSLRYIKRFDPESNDISVICQSLKDSEDFELIAGGAYLMAKGSSIFYYHPLHSIAWTEVLNLSEYGINNITRVSVNRGRIAIVSNK